MVEVAVTVIAVFNRVHGTVTLKLLKLFLCDFCVVMAYFKLLRYLLLENLKCQGN
jgi:hypothetical protein